MRGRLWALWNHPAGPKTIHFWAPTAKWALVLAGVSDLARPADKLSLSQSLCTKHSLFISAGLDGDDLVPLRDADPPKELEPICRECVSRCRQSLPALPHLPDGIIRQAMSKELGVSAKVSKDGLAAMAVYLDLVTRDAIARCEAFCAQNDRAQVDADAINAIATSFLLNFA